MAENNDTEIEEPKSLDDAERQLMIFRNMAENIQAQLSERNRRIPNVKRSKLSEYHIWRSSAIQALNSSNRKIRFLKNWISLHKQPSILDQVLELVEVDPDMAMALIVKYKQGQKNDK